MVPNFGDFLPTRLAIFMKKVVNISSQTHDTLQHWLILYIPT
jgi:hypothetical protein